MHPKQWGLLLVNLIGGIAVLGSYALGILTKPGTGQALWGGVPESVRPLYTANMFLAAMGYFAFTFYVLFRLDPQKTRIAGRFGYGLLTMLYAVILFPSALWLPLTFLAVERSSLILAWAVRIVLWLVALASLALFFAILKAEPRQSITVQRIALAGCTAFCIQTVILDAIGWVIFFRIS